MGAGETCGAVSGGVGDGSAAGFWSSGIVEGSTDGVCVDAEGIDGSSEPGTEGVVGFVSGVISSCPVQPTNNASSKQVTKLTIKKENIFFISYTSLESYII